MARHLFAAEAWEGRLILSVDGSGSSVLATASAAAEVATTSTPALTTATATAASSTTAATGALRLDEAVVEVDGLLDLALPLALLLAAAADEVVLLLVLEGLGALPLLVELAALVGAADAQAALEGELLLGLLGEVVGVGDALVLGLGRLLGSGVLGEGLLLLGLSDGLTGLLVLQLSLTLSGAPGSGSLLLGTTRRTLVYVASTSQGLSMVLTPAHHAWRGGHPTREVGGSRALRAGVSK